MLPVVTAAYAANPRPVRLSQSKMVISESLRELGLSNRQIATASAPALSPGWYQPRRCCRRLPNLLGGVSEVAAGKVLLNIALTALLLMAVFGLAKRERSQAPPFDSLCGLNATRLRSTVTKSAAGLAPC